MARKKVATDPIEALANGSAEDILRLILWKGRHRNPTMTVVIKPEDITSLDACASYLRVKPAVVWVRPGGRPATPAVQPRNGHRGSPAMPAEPPRNHVVVALVNAGTMDAIRPLEDTDEGAQILEREQERRRWASKARDYAGDARRMANGGDVSSAVLNDIAACLDALGRPDND